MIKDLIDKLEFCCINTELSENWGFLQVSGDYKDKLIQNFNSLYDLLKNYSCENLLTFYIDEENVSFDEINDYFKDGCKWSINLNKLGLLYKSTDNINQQFFFSKDEFLKWIKNINPFSPENPINNKKPLKIIVRELDDFFGGPNIIVCSERDTITFDSLYKFKLPTYKNISETIHIISNDNIEINPLNHLITFGNTKNIYAKIFLNNSAIVLSSCLINEYYENDKIILRGIKRIQLKLYSNELNQDIDLEYILKLCEVVEWVYNDKVETRLKLFIDRVTLDIDFDKSFKDELVYLIESCFIQAKERYNFVIIERKDQYLKELRDLLKDIKSQSDLYSIKIRSLLSNLLRDVLAGFLLVGFSFFTKVTEITKLKEEQLIEFVFKGFAIYFAVSAIIQTLVDLFDIAVSKKEIYYWKNVTREFIPQKEFEKHIKDSLHNRKRSIKILYPIIIVIYFVISVLSWNFPFIWNTYLIK